MSTMQELQQQVDKHVGKTVQSIEAFNSYVRIIFTDGTSVEIGANSSEESWITIDD